MDYRFADQLAHLKPSAIREILKSAGDPNLISFAAGNPAPEAFPGAALADAAAHVFGDNPAKSLQYSVTEGYAPLRARVADLVRERQNISAEPEEVLITSGAQQAIELAARVLCNPDDVILCESPSFIGSLNSFRSHRIRLRGVEMEQDGLNLASLEQALKEEPNAKLLYIIANFQNPTGCTTSLAKRKAILELCARYNVVILEDDPYGELRFAGEKVPTIKSMDQDGLVVYCGSFSKTIAPGLRLGFAVADKDLLAKMTVAKQGEDVHSSLPIQMIAHKFLTEQDYGAHIERLQAIYRKKCKLMLDGVEAHFSKQITVTRPEGGLFVWATLPDGIDMPAFCKEAVKRLVAVVPGTAFNTDEDAPSQSFRMNYSTPTDDQLRSGTEILGKLTVELCGR